MANLLTAREIAEKTKFTRAYVDYVLNGERTPSPAAAIKFEEATGVTRLAWMYPGEYVNPYMRQKASNE